MSRHKITINALRFFNGWPLLVVLAGLVSVAMAVHMWQVDLSLAEGVSSMIAYSVRWSVPWLYLAFAASSLRALFPQEWSLWLLRNRRYFGLAFAAGFSWQLLFIAWLVIGHPDYFQEVNPISSLYVQVPGYIALTAMTVTSFHPVRRMMRPQHWRWLHKIAIYYIWIVVWGTYWFELYYYEGPDRIDYVYYWLGLAAWLPRPLAWARKKSALGPRVHTAVAVGVLLALFASFWGEAVYAVYAGLAEAIRAQSDLLVVDVLVGLLEYIPPTLPVLLVALLLPLLVRPQRSQT